MTDLLGDFVALLLVGLVVLDDLLELIFKALNFVTVLRLTLLSAKLLAHLHAVVKVEHVLIIIFLMELTVKEASRLLHVKLSNGLFPLLNSPLLLGMFEELCLLLFLIDGYRFLNVTIESDDLFLELLESVTSKLLLIDK